MKQLKKDFQAVTNGLKELAKKTEKMVKAIEKLDKAQAVQKPKAKSATKAKPKKAPAKKPAAKKATGQTATDQVVNIIKQNENGVDVPTLIKETGLQDKQIRNIVFKASKQGTIKRAGRGVYVGV